LAASRSDADDETRNDFGQIAAFLLPRPIELNGRMTTAGKP
jgi:hypothetical protein